MATSSFRLALAAVVLAAVAPAVPAAAAGACVSVAPAPCSYSGSPRASMVLVAAEGPWSLTWACATSGTRSANGRGSRLLLRAHYIGESCTVTLTGSPAVLYGGPAPLDRVPIDE